MLRILHNTKFDFIRRWKPAAIGLAVFLVPAIVLIAISGFRYSIEFTSGTRMELKFKQAPDISVVRSTLATGGVPGAEISTFGSPEEIVIRAQDEATAATLAGGAESVAARVQSALQRQFGAGSFEVLQTEAVGPRVGSELRRSALLAMLIAFGITLVYLAWRFEWRFAVAAVLATVHDIVATMAFVRFLNLEISLFVVGALLTVVGYSMNDKVVVFDRVRENLKTAKGEPLYNLLNRSVNETLPRTVMTGSTTLACLLALLIFGGDVIRPFAWVLTFGIIIGTFSSIYVASPLLLWIERRWPRQAGEKHGVSARMARAEGTPTPPVDPRRRPAPRQSAPTR